MDRSGQCQVAALLGEGGPHKVEAPLGPFLRICLRRVPRDLFSCSAGLAEEEAEMRRLIIVQNPIS